MNLDYIHGQMVGCMMDFTRMTRNIVMVFIHGPIRKNMQDGGTMASSMDLVFLFQKRARKSLACGRMVKNYVGFLKKKQNKLKVDRWNLNHYLKTRKKVG